jgi:endonuclease III
VPKLTDLNKAQEDAKRRATTIVGALKRQYSSGKVALHHSSALELLVATILSAQCTDERVNTVTPGLFKKYRSARQFAEATPAELEMIIRSTGFYHAKARNIIKCCRALVEHHEGNVPGTMEELVQLAGVGRKTANVLLGAVFGRSEGIVVDTHVKRLSQRLGFSRQQDPEKIEQDLMSILPKRNWIAIGNLLIQHGRTVCHARSPRCVQCTLQSVCPSVQLP